MKSSLPLLAICLLGAAASANLFQNGNFEDTFVGFNGNIHAPGADTILGGETFAGWSVSGHSVDLIDREFVVPAQGRNSVDLVGLDAGGIYQDIPVVPGATYHLRFAMTAGTGLFRPMLAAMNVSDGVGFSENFTFLSIRQVYPGQEWEYHELDFIPSQSPARLTFRDITPGNLLTGAIIDDISLEGPFITSIPDGGGMVAILAMALTGIAAEKITTPATGAPDPRTPSQIIQDRQCLARIPGANIP